jgi:hypothetical protein
MAQTYAQKVAAIKADKDLTATEKSSLIGELAKAEYGTSAFNLGEFEGLLGKLEASKMKQQAQKSSEGRRDIFATGLAQMMSNF